MKKGLVLFVSFLILTTMSIVSCGDDDDGDGAVQEYGEPSLELGRYTSECKASNKAGRSEKTIIDISAHYVIVTNYGYKYTGALSCEEANNTSVLELSYQYKKQRVFKGSDLISLTLEKAILTPKTEEEADKYNEEEKYDFTYWEEDHGELITEEYMEKSAKENRDITKMLVKTSKNFLYALPFTGESTADVLTSVEKFAKVNLTLTLGTYQKECDEADGLGLDDVTLEEALGIRGPLAGQSVIGTIELKENELTITHYYYSYEGLTPTCEEANKLYTTTAKLSYTKTTHRSGFALQMNLISGSSTIHDNDLLTYANGHDVEDLYNQRGWVLNTPKDLTSFMNQEAESSGLTAAAKTVGNTLYVGPYDGELDIDVENDDSEVYTKTN